MERVKARNKILLLTEFEENVKYYMKRRGNSEALWLCGKAVEKKWPYCIIKEKFTAHTYIQSQQATWAT